MCLIAHQIHRTRAHIDPRSNAIGTTISGSLLWRLPHMVLECLLLMQMHALSIASKCVELIQSVVCLLLLLAHQHAQVEILESGRGNHHIQ